MGRSHGEDSTRPIDLHHPGTDAREKEKLTPTRDSAPPRIGRYRLLKLLGKGGFGEVYSAEDLALGRHVAIKMLHADLGTSIRRRLVQEARAAARLQHPFIATFYEAGESEDRSFLVMELVEAQTLRRRLRDGALDVLEALSLCAGLLEALCHAHAAGVLHRDIKPENVMVTDRGPKLLDFGLARFSPEASLESMQSTMTQLTLKGQVLGTVGYMSPEQLRGDAVDVRSDLFTVATVLYEMLTAEPAFPGESPTQRIAAVFSHDPPIIKRPGLPAGVNQMIRKALARDPANRYPSAMAFLADLRRISEGRAVIDLPDTLAIPDLENLSRDPDDAWIGSGMAESLTADLSRVEGLKVIAREKLFKAAGDNPVCQNTQDAGELGRKLGCRWVLSGGFQRIGAALRVTACLVDASAGTTVREQKFDGTLECVFAMQDNLAMFVKETLQQTMAQNDRATVFDADAFELYARGRLLFLSLGKGGIQQAGDLFLEAVMADPTYAPALAGLAGVHAMAYTYSSDPEHLEKALEFASRTLVIDPGNAEAHTWLGYALFRQGKSEEAFHHECEAIKLDPLHAPARYMAALCQWDLGRRADALSLAQAAVETQPEASYYWCLLGWLHLELGRLEESVWSLEQAVQTSVTEPAAAPGLFAGILAECLRRAGRLQEARARCLEGMEQIENTDHMHRDYHRVTALLALGRVSLDQGDAESAKAAFRQAEVQTRGRTAGVGVGHARVQALAGLARAGHDAEKLVEALSLFRARKGYDFGCAPALSDDFTLSELSRAATALGKEEEVRAFAKALAKPRSTGNSGMI